MENMETLCRTPLYQRHLDAGAKMASFGGFKMPIQYQGIVEEHLSTRRESALFDTCHMGEFRVEGPGALNDLERLVTCPVADLREGRCRYGLLCNEKGGVIDDLLVYRLARDSFMLVVNAGTRGNDWAWINDKIGNQTRLLDESEATAKIDLQGPKAPVIADELLDETIAGMVFFSFRNNSFKGESLLVSRTGYTGEIGFEFYGSPDLITALWDDCLASGAIRAGLGARDTLRLEMGMPLHGHELDEERNAGESGFSRAIADDKNFIGSESVRNSGFHRQRLCGVSLPGRRAARSGQTILDVSGINEIGTVTSGSFAPSLNHAVALAYIDSEEASIEAEVRIAGGRRELNGKIVELPFYRQATGRTKMERFLKSE